jgi:hypothetical protein
MLWLLWLLLLQIEAYISEMTTFSNLPDDKALPNSTKYV